MGALEIVIIILAVALVVFTIVYNIIKRRKGGSGCGSCSGCAFSSGCASAKMKDETDDKKEAKDVCYGCDK